MWSQSAIPRGTPLTLPSAIETMFFFVTIFNKIELEQSSEKMEKERKKTTKIIIREGERGREGERE